MSTRCAINALKQYRWPVLAIAFVLVLMTSWTITSAATGHSSPTYAVEDDFGNNFNARGIVEHDMYSSYMTVYKLWLYMDVTGAGDELQCGALN